MYVEIHAWTDEIDDGCMADMKESAPTLYMV